MSYPHNRPLKGQELMKISYEKKGKQIANHSGTQQVLPHWQERSRNLPPNVQWVQISTSEYPSLPLQEELEEALCPPFELPKHKNPSTGSSQDDNAGSHGKNTYTSPYAAPVQTAMAHGFGAQVEPTHDSSYTHEALTQPTLDYNRIFPHYPMWGMQYYLMLEAAELYQLGNNTMTHSAQNPFIPPWQCAAPAAQYQFMPRRRFVTMQDSFDNNGEDDRDYDYPLPEHLINMDDFS